MLHFMTTEDVWGAWELAWLRSLSRGLREAREAAGLSQGELAEQAGVSKGLVVNLESAAKLKEPRVRSMPNVATLTRIALALGVPPVQLLYSDLPVGEVEVWPNTKVPSYVALQWFSGEISSAQVADTAAKVPPELSTMVDRASTEVTDAVRAYVALQKRVQVAAENATYAESDEQRDMMMGIYRQGLAELEKLKADMNAGRPTDA